MSTAPTAETIQVVAVETVEPDALRGLYDAVGWSTYTQDMGVLTAAIAGSDFVVVAKKGSELIGLARAVSDDASIAYI